MRIVFFGTAEFAVPSLEALIASRHQVLLCVTQPERPQGRGLRPAPSPVERVARAHRLPLLQPERPSAPEYVQRVAEARADLLVVIAYGHILRPSLLTVAPHGAISVHPSLLPRYRGAAPVPWAIINGDHTTGVSVLRLAETVDTGDLITQASVAIAPDETAVALAQRLAVIGATCLVESIDLIATGRVSYRPQSSFGASSARKLTKEDGRIDWTAGAAAIHNVVRGAQPWPGAYTWWRERRLNLWRTQVLEATDATAAPGTIVGSTARRLIVATGHGGQMLIQELQLAGGTRLRAEAFLRGHRIAVGDRLTS